MKKSISRVCSDALFFLFLFSLPTQLGKHFFFNFSYLSGVRVDYLAPTVYLTDILLILLISINYRTVFLFFKQRGIIVVLLLFLVPVFLSLSPPVSAYRYIKIVELFALFAIARRSLKNSFVFSGFTIMAIVQFVLSILQLIYKHSVGGLSYFLGERYLTLSTPGIAKGSIAGVEILRPYGTFSHPNSLAGFYLVVYFFFLTDHRFEKKPLIKYVTLFFSTMLIFFSFSKIAIGVFFLLNILFLFMVQKKAFCKVCIISRVMMLIVLASIFFQLKGDVFSFEKRIMFLKNSLTIIDQRPLQGVGLGAFVIAQNQYPARFLDMINQPVHNVFILFLAENGTIITLIIFIALFLALRRIRKKRQFYLLVSIFLVTGMLDHYWLTLQQNMLLLGSIGGLTLSVSRR